MDITQNEQNGVLTIALSGRLDALSAPELQKALEGVEERADRLALELSNVEYISSAGLRALLMAHKKMAARGGMKVTGANQNVRELFEVTGFSEIFDVEKPLKSVSIDGCELIGEGMCGKCYRLDGETLLKLYNKDMDEGMIAREKQLARCALVMGLPTAISYDMVECGGQKGVVFEMLDAKTLGAAMAADTGNIEEYARLFVRLSKSIHSTPADTKLLPDRAELYMQDALRADWLGERKAELIALLEGLPKADTCLHGDLQPSNVLLQNGEPVLIDMGDLAAGHPYYDCSHVYNLFVRDYSTDISRLTTRLDKPERQRFWREYVKGYFCIETRPADDGGSVGGADYYAMLRQLKRFNCVRQLFYIENFPGTAQDNRRFVLDVLDDFNDAR